VAMSSGSRTSDGGLLAPLSPPLARIAVGYADQADPTREYGLLAGLSPAALLAEGATPAVTRRSGAMSEPFKTARPGAATLPA
jgi:hypothetical protein